MRKLLVTILIIIIAVPAILFAKYIILDKTSVAILKFDPISGAVSKGLQVSTGTNYLPIAGKDFKINKVVYFDNNTWAVVTIIPVGGSADPATLILEQNSGNYKAVVGPDNSFNGVDLTLVPSDVKNYVLSPGGS